MTWPKLRNSTVPLLAGIGTLIHSAVAQRGVPTTIEAVTACLLIAWFSLVRSMES